MALVHVLEVVPDVEGAEVEVFVLNQCLEIIVVGRSDPIGKSPGDVGSGIPARPADGL